VTNILSITNARIEEGRWKESTCKEMDLLQQANIGSSKNDDVSRAITLGTSLLSLVKSSCRITDDGQAFSRKRSRVSR